MRIILILMLSLVTSLTHAQSFEEVIKEFIDDAGNGYENALEKHSLNGSGHFEEIDGALGYYSNFDQATSYDLYAIISTEDDWQPVYDETKKKLDKANFIKKEGWTWYDDEEGIGGRYVLNNPDEEMKIIRLYFGESYTGKQNIVGLTMEVLCAACEAEIADINDYSFGEVKQLASEKTTENEIEEKEIELHPNVKKYLGCDLGDCENGFGALTFVADNNWNVYTYKGNFVDGLFNGPGVFYSLSDIEMLSLLDYELTLDKRPVSFIGYFVDGMAVAQHKNMGFTEMDFCKVLNRSEDCEKWKWTIDQYSKEKDNFAVATFATRIVGQEGRNYGFVQHAAFADNKTVKFDKPFAADFGECVSGNCRGGEGKLKLEDIGVLEGTFDEEGIVSDSSILTLLSGEVYQVESIRGIPMKFTRIALPSNLSWKQMARVGSWLMIQENTCLEGDCRTENGVMSFVKDEDGNPLQTPGYFTRKSGKPVLTTYYHTGYENEKFHRENNPDYDFSFTYDDFYDVLYNADFLHKERQYMGEFGEIPILDGEYTTSSDGKEEQRYYKDGIRYTADYSKPFDQYYEDLAKQREKEFRDEIDAYYQAEQEKIEAARRAKEAEEHAKTHAHNSSNNNGEKIYFGRPFGTQSKYSQYACPECIGLKVVPVVESVKRRQVKETDYFFESYYTYENQVTGYETCPVCNGTGKVEVLEF